MTLRIVRVSRSPHLHLRGTMSGRTILESTGTNRMELAERRLREREAELAVAALTTRSRTTLQPVADAIDALTRVAAHDRALRQKLRLLIQRAHARLGDEQCVVAGSDGLPG